MTLEELFTRAQGYHQAGNFWQAEQFYRQILQTDPTHADCFHYLGLIAHQTGDHETAVALMRQAFALNPNAESYHGNLAMALYALGRTEEALVSFTESARLNPNDAPVHNNLGIALLNLGELAEAVGCFRKTLGISPQHVAAHNNLGVALMSLGLYAEAIEHFEQAMHFQPDHVNARCNRAILGLLHGDLERHWGDYELRWQLNDMAPPSFAQPRWNGSTLTGRTILLYADQGLGDTIHFIRYAALVKLRGGTVLVECQPVLRPLLEGVAGVDVLVALGQTLPAFDVEVPLPSLPGIFGTTLATIPADIPYLRANPRLVDHWRAETNQHGTIATGTVGSGLNIGIAWQGNVLHKDDRERSLPLSAFAPLARIEGVLLFSLQVGQGTQQLAGASFPVTDLGSRFDPNSLEDLAAGMMNLDLVLTVDTVVAHLAGALGLRVWTLLPLVSDWRWFLERSDSPWYPTMRLFRQKQRRDWGEVIERVVAEVRNLI